MGIVGNGHGILHHRRSGRLLWWQWRRREGEGTHGGRGVVVGMGGGGGVEEDRRGVMGDGKELESLDLGEVGEEPREW
jgi:hypothetical protein